MTTACVLTLGLSLTCYLVAAVLFQVHFLRHKTGFETWGRRILLVGLATHALGMGLHMLLSGQSPFAHRLTVLSLGILGLLSVGQVVERFARVRHLNLLLAPMAFLGLLYALVLPVRLDGAHGVLFKYPWLGVHVSLVVLGQIGFAIAFCTANIYLIQARNLKQGRLSHYLPALDTAANTTFYSVGIGFFFFTIGLLMGVIWLFGSPGEYLGPKDSKIWMALPAWAVFALYLYLRGVAGQFGSRLKWLVVAGFLLVLANLLAVPHDFRDTAQSADRPASLYSRG